MSETPQRCPKCDGPMEQGFTVDLGTAGEMFYGERHVSRWAPGAPLRSLLSKTRVAKNWLPIGTYRCATCGYLESYARPEFATKGQTQFSLRSLFIFITIVAVLLGLIVLFARDFELR